MLMMEDDCGVLTLNVDIRCGDNGQCTCIKTPQGPITAKKNGNIGDAEGFVRHTHESKEKFTLLHGLGEDEKLSNEIPNVTRVSVYYWDGDISHEKPLLLKVVKEVSTGRPDYYYKYSECEGGQAPKIWKLNTAGYPLQVMLDDRNW